MIRFGYTPWLNNRDMHAVASFDLGRKRAWVSIRIFKK